MVEEIKIVLLGSGGCGKGNVITQFVQGIFVEKYDPTIEDSYRKLVEVDGRQTMLEILDTAGTEQFTAMRDLYLKDGHGFVFVYSIIAQSTFNDIPEWRDQVVRVKDVDSFPGIIVGNNVDLEDSRVITTEQGQALASKFNFKFIEASARTKFNIDEIFYTLLRQIRLNQKPKGTQQKKDKKSSSMTLSNVFKQLKYTPKRSVKNLKEAQTKSETSIVESQPKSESSKVELQPKSKLSKVEVQPKLESSRVEPKSKSPREEPHPNSRVEPKSESSIELQPKSKSSRVEPQPKLESSRVEPQPKSSKIEFQPKLESSREEPQPKLESSKIEPQPQTKAESSKVELQIQPNIKIVSDTQINLHNNNNSSTNRTFENSIYMKYYNQNSIPKYHFDILSAIKSLIEVYQKENKDSITESQTEEFINQLHRETMTSATKDELIGEVETISVLLWTSALQLNGKELCSILNYTIRSDKEEYMKQAVTFSRGINLLCVTRSKTSFLKNWPTDNITYRGGGLPSDKQYFFKPDTIYRAPMFVATSFRQDVAYQFARQAQMNGVDPVLWYFHFDSKFKCVHVNYVQKSNVKEEEEFLFSAYSVFTVKSVDWKDEPNWKNPHEIHLLVSPDNLLEPTGLPLAPWC